MTMNRTKIEWCGGGYTWNPCTGCDKPYCQYCYALKVATRFNGNKAFPNGFLPTFHPDRIGDPGKIKTPSLVFTCSMGDLFCNGMKQEWRQEVFESMSAYTQHNYLILTKRPENIYDSLYGQKSDFYLGGGDYYRNIWLGVTVDTVNAVKRLDQLREFKERSGGDWRLFASFEPLLEEMPTNLNLDELEWVIIGQRTKPNNNPPLSWILKIMGNAASNLIPVFIKNNLLHYFASHRDLQIYPTEFTEYIRK